MDLGVFGARDCSFNPTRPTAGEDAALESACITAKLGGRVVVVGIPPRANHTFAATEARRKGFNNSAQPLFFEGIVIVR